MYQNREELAGKIDWEGGLQDALDYGITLADMPPGDDELHAAWARLEETYRPFVKARDAVNRLLDQDGSGW